MSTDVAPVPSDEELHTYLVRSKAAQNLFLQASTFVQTISVVESDVRKLLEKAADEDAPLFMVLEQALMHQVRT